MKRLLTCIVVVCAAATGCGSPDRANIELRKKNAGLRDEIAQLKRQHEADLAAIRGLEHRATTAPVLPTSQIDQLFTVHGLAFGRLTDADEKGLKIYVVPTDAMGQKIKAAGSFVVDAFDLSKQSDNLVAHCEYPLQQAPKIWFGEALLYNYVLVCPWHSPPEHSELTVKVTFTDALTQRVFTAQKAVKVPSVQPK